MKLKQFFDDDVEAFLGLAPTSTSPQPAHVLNGFLHHSLTGKRSWKGAVELVAQRQGLWVQNSEKLRGRTALALPDDDVELDRLRHAVGGLVAADGAVFNAFASFQTAHLGMVTSDTTHNKLGTFAARLALTSPECRQYLELLVERLQQPQSNPHWTLQQLLSDVDVSSWNVELRDPAPDDWWAATKEGQSLANELQNLLLRALRLAAEGRDSLVGLQVLASVCTWVGLVAFAQVPSLAMSRGLVPLLLEAGAPGELEGLRSSSADSLRGALTAFDNWLILRLNRRLRLDLPDDATDDDAQALLKKVEPYSLAGGSTVPYERLLAIYNLWRRDQDVIESLAHTLQDALHAQMGNKPAKWFSAVGRHCGFVGPRRGGPARFRIEVNFAPALLLAGLDEDDGEAVPFGVWQGRLEERFGVVLGPAALARQLRQRAPEEELEANEQLAADLFAGLGLARRYSDGVTEVLNPLTVWSAK